MTDYIPSMSQVEAWLDEPLYVTETEIGKLRQLYSIDERRLQRLVQQIAADVAQNLQVLAKPEPEGPTDKEIMELMPQEMHDDFSAAARAMAEQAGTDSTTAKGLLRIILNRHAVDMARAVLARWGNHRGILGNSPQPSSGEVAELVAWLRVRCQLMDDRPGSEFHLFTRAAELLSRLSPPQYTPMSERFPNLRPESEGGDCDAEGRCWWFCPPDFIELRSHATAGSAFVAGATHWLPFSALPLPSGDA